MLFWLSELAIMFSIEYEGLNILLCPLLVSRIFGSRGLVSFGFVVLGFEALGLLLSGEAFIFVSTASAKSLWLLISIGGPIRLAIFGLVMTDVLTEPETGQLPMCAALTLAS